jgi:uncharacterized protein (TIGR00661 family)
MGRILYGVMGDAGGHVARSSAIAQRLKDHEIVFVGGGRVAELAKAGYSVVATPMLGTALEGNRVRPLATAMNAVVALRNRSTTIERLCAVIREFDPDLIVTDYEYFLPIAARRLGRDCISVDRQHALTLCDYRPPPGNPLSRWLTLGIIRGMYSTANHYVVCSFDPMRPLDPRLTEVLPPVLREDVVRIRPSSGEHAVVYLRGISPAWLRELLQGRARRFVVYGFDVEREEGNLTFRRGSDEGFLTDLSSAAYVISNGGHNLISEALYYRKPIMCFPVGLFYEQLVNAHLLAQSGCGAYHGAGPGAAAALDAFETSLPIFGSRLAARGSWDCQAIPARLRSLMSNRSSVAKA